MSEIRVTSVVGENGGDPVGLTTGFTVGPLTGTTGIGATITHHGHAQFAGVCTATSFVGSGANLTGVSAGGASNIAFNAGKGIDYSAQTASSASGVTVTSEIVDHYEEGTWTPTLENAGSTTYSTQNGKYTRIGNVVYVTATIIINSHDNSATSVTGFQGLPYPNSSNGQTVVFHIAGNENWDTDLRTNNLTGWLTNGSSTIRIYKNSGNNLNSISVNDIGNNGELFVTGHYFVS